MTVRRIRSGWRSRWTELQCKVSRRTTRFVLDSGYVMDHEEIELSCPHAPPEVACEDHSW